MGGELVQVAPVRAEPHQELHGVGVAVLCRHRRRGRLGIVAARGSRRRATARKTRAWGYAATEPAVRKESANEYLQL